MAYADDDTKKAQWVKTVRTYLIGRSLEMMQLLLWAEGFQKHVIVFMDIQNMPVERAHMQDIVLKPMKASSEVLAFLSLNTTGNGRNKFDAAQGLNGLDVWRRIVVHCCPEDSCSTV